MHRYFHHQRRFLLIILLWRVLISSSSSSSSCKTLAFSSHIPSSTLSPASKITTTQHYQFHTTTTTTTARRRRRWRTNNKRIIMNPICINDDYYDDNNLPPFLTTLKAAMSSPTTSNNAVVASSVASVVATTIIGGASSSSSPIQSVDPLVSSMYLVRILFLRGLAFVYGVAFLIAYKQNKALIGDNGITPARHILNQADKRSKSIRQQRQSWIDTICRNKTLKDCKYNIIRYIGYKINQTNLYQEFLEKFWDRQDGIGRVVTSVLWLAPDRKNLNGWLNGIAICGMTISAIVFMLGTANFPLLFTLWICQRSLMSVGGTFYGYGWEPQLAELGFHSLFLVPFLTLTNSKFVGPPMPYVPVYLIRWYLFRIMIGAGLIKMKSNDKKWKDLTTMNYFYETQPVPNPFTKYFHYMPTLWHKFEVLTNHFVELVAPFLLIIPGLPTNLRRAGGLIQIIFQLTLITSGNLSFLNWLTLVPAILCLDDAFVSSMFSPAQRTAAMIASSYFTEPTLIRKVIMVAFTLLIGKLSIPVIQNLFFTKKQIMNTSFDKLRLVNTYGAFGTVHEDRYELIIKSASNVNGPWKEYEFMVKPDNIYKRPMFISPYHYRIDWQMWIACVIGRIERSPWIYSFLLKLLQQDQDVIGLLKHDPWQQSTTVVNSTTITSSSTDDTSVDDERPKYIRIDRYLYTFHRNSNKNKKPTPEGEDNGSNDDDDTPEEEENSSRNNTNKQTPYWDREYVGRFFPKQGVATEETLKDYLRWR